ncbi:MAG: hypothetical protein KatS3mg057_2234 [Herpetosiphonaceae bacterium]|nr:MAG: hypothetical protein KatS3mg057_2234 [Herpetosiphonaceae bacterium]
MTESYDPTPNHQSPGEDVFVFPASFAQQRLWFIEQFLPGSAAYTIPRAIHLTGPLDPTILEQALNVVVERHEVLRTTFISLQGEPHQVVKPSLRLEIPVVDLRSFAPEEREAEAQRLIAEEAGKPFDLSTGPLIRASLLRLADQEHILLLTMHHIISDGWSMGILIRELGMAAEALNAGRSIQLPPLPIQYADYAEWQREWLQGELLEQQLNYWREQLRDAPALLELPTDHPRPAVQTMRGATLVHELPSELLLKLHALSKAENATLFMTLLAAFQTLLHRYSGQDDILVGTPVAGRTRAELEGLIGFFVNTLVMRAQFYDNPSFRTLLSRVRETALGAFAHQDLPFEKLVEELKPERSTSHSPLFQVMFALQNAPDSPLQGSGQVGGLRIRPLHVPAAIAKFDLTLELTEVEHGLVAAFEYNADLFDAETIARLARHFQILLEAVVAQPDLPVGRLPLLGDNERRRLLDEWNATTTTYPRASTIHQLFEAQAGLLPDAVAVSFLGSQLTYRELNERANRLAHHLRSLGVGPGVYVGVCLERSLDLVVALLGILKAGGAYAPLEPDYPRERLAFMFEDIRPAVLIAQQRLLDTLPYQQPHIICLDGETDLLADYPETTPSAGAAADSPAYIMYTSGSTGQPKGIIIPHRAVVRLVKETNYAHFGPDEVFLQLAPIAFDASTLEIWGPLLNGGRLAIAPAPAALAGGARAPAGG